jgi:uncharacterized membrane protein YecN with MAPEG domain
MPADITQGLGIVGFYGGLLGLVLVWLAIACVFARQAAHVSIGDGGDARLIRAMRGQANYTEYVPLCLVLFALMAGLGAPPWELHALGLALTLGRVAHALHFTRASAPAWQRGAGAGLTLLALIGASVGLLVHTLPRIF